MIVCKEEDLKAAILASVAPIVAERDVLFARLMKALSDHRTSLLVATHEQQRLVYLHGALRDLVTECEAAGLSPDGLALQNAKEVLRAPVRQ